MLKSVSFQYHFPHLFSGGELTPVTGHVLAHGRMPKSQWPKKEFSSLTTNNAKLSFGRPTMNADVGAPSNLPSCRHYPVVVRWHNTCVLQAEDAKRLHLPFFSSVIKTISQNTLRFPLLSSLRLELRHKVGLTCRGV